MTQSNISIRIDNQLKQQFDSLCNELGLSMTSALNLFVKTVVREQRIPFEIKKETPNKVTKAALDEYEEMKQNKDKYKRYNSFKDILEEV